VTVLPARRLTIVVCAAGPATHVRALVELAHHRDWSVTLIATPSALPFLDQEELEHLTGHELRSNYPAPDPGRTRSITPPDAIIVAPATYNTICKLALGISDTYALGVLAEALGAATPVVILPFVNTSLAARAPFLRAVDSLRTEGARVLIGAPGATPHPPGTGNHHLISFPWTAALELAESAATQAAYHRPPG
jgi:phosphopantothenoylcysteine synthetase/decarboxylase